MSARALGTSLLVGLFISLSSIARAEEAPPRYPDCPKTPSDTDVDAAKAAFRAGQAAFNEGDYARAITYWEDAYRRDCTAHALLLNLSRAYELSGQPRHVVHALKTYNSRSTDPVQREQNTRRIDKLSAQIEAEDRARPPVVVAAPLPAAEAQPTPTPQPVAATAPTPVEEPTAKRPIYPLFIAGGGALLGIISGVLWIGAQNKYTDYLNVNCTLPEGGGDYVCERNTQDGDGNDIADRADSLRNTTYLTGGLAIGGGVIAVAGVAWYFLQSPSSSTEAVATTRRWGGVRVTPALWPGVHGVIVDGPLPAF